MASKIKAQADSTVPARSYDETVMEVLDRLDALRDIARHTGDAQLADGLDAVFESFLTRYCDSRHEALNAQMRQDVRRPKAFMH